MAPRIGREVRVDMAGFAKVVCLLFVLAALTGGCAQSAAPRPSATATSPKTAVPSPTGLGKAPVPTPTSVPVGSPASATVEPSPTPATAKLKVYYSRVVNNDIEFVPVERNVPRTVAVGRAAITELLKGPTPEEKAQGLYNPIPSNARLLSLKIVDGVAYADFDEALQFQVGGSLRVMAIRKVITLTLLQFSTVQKVIISIEGRTEDILQP